MDRRQFLALGPAFPVSAVTGSLVVREDGKEPIELDVQVLKVQPGDVLVFRPHGYLSPEGAQRIEAFMESSFPGLKAMVLDKDLSLEGVLRTT